jgi:hypothetical protein
MKRALDKEFRKPNVSVQRMLCQPKSKMCPVKYINISEGTMCHKTDLNIHYGVADGYFEIIAARIWIEHPLAADLFPSRRERFRDFIGDV